MRPSTLAALAGAAVVSAQSSTVVNAPVVTTNPVGASYVATLPKKEGSNVAGSITGVSASDGKGVRFAVSISGLPAGTGPWMYHVHEKPVPTDGNCTGTGAHLDPYKRGEVPVCDPTKPETCQTGDLAGKFTNFTTEADSKAFLDLYSATDPTNVAFFGNLSIVVHTSNKSRIACANFTQLAAGVTTSLAPTSLPVPTANGTASLVPIGTGAASLTGANAQSTYSSPSPTQPAPPQVTVNSAGRFTVAGMAVLAGLAALVL